MSFTTLGSPLRVRSHMWWFCLGGWRGEEVMNAGVLSEPLLGRIDRHVVVIAAYCQVGPVRMEG